MRIGELARESGVTTSRIRFYETAGLVASSHRTEAGYRVFAPSVVQDLRLIETAQLAGFTLAEIRGLLPGGRDQEWDRTALLAGLRDKLASVRQLQQDLKAREQRLAAVLAEVENKPDDLDCHDNAARILSKLGAPPVTARSA